VLAETLADGFGFSRPQQAVVHENARKLAADRPRQQGRDDRRIDAARESADDPALAHAVAQLTHLLLDERAHLPVAAAAADVADEIPQELSAELGVGHFRMKLQTENRPLAMADRRRRAVHGARQGRPLSTQVLHLVAMAHPYRQLVD